MTRAGLANPDDRDKEYLDWLQRDLRLHLVPDAGPEPDVAGWQPLPPELAARLAIEHRHDN